MDKVAKEAADRAVAETKAVNEKAAKDAADRAATEKTADSTPSSLPAQTPSGVWEEGEEEQEEQGATDYRTIMTTRRR